jgi:hypothetical protein
MLCAGSLVKDGCPTTTSRDEKGDRSNTMKVLVIVAHPNRASFNHAIAQTCECSISLLRVQKRRGRDGYPKSPQSWTASSRQAAWSPNVHSGVTAPVLMSAVLGTITKRQSQANNLALAAPVKHGEGAGMKTTMAAYC